MRIFKIRLNNVKIFLQYFIFYFSIGISLILEYLFLNILNTKILEFFNLSIFNHLPFLTIGIFIISYFILNLIFKIFTKKDSEYIESIFTKEKISHKFIRKLSKILKYILR